MTEPPAVAGPEQPLLLRLRMTESNRDFMERAFSMTSVLGLRAELRSSTYCHPSNRKVSVYWEPRPPRRFR